MAVFGLLLAAGLASAAEKEKLKVTILVRTWLLLYLWHEGAKHNSRPIAEFPASHRLGRRPNCSFAPAEAAWYRRSPPQASPRQAAVPSPPVVLP